MDLLEQTELTPLPTTTDDIEPAASSSPQRADAGASTDPADAAALLGLPPGVSAPEGVEALTVAANTQNIEWYHLDPAENYQELRLGTGPGIWRGLAFGGLMSVLAIGLFYAFMWMVEPSAGMLNPFVDRSYSEARDDMAIHLGGLAPLAASPSSPGTTQPVTGKKFDLADLRSAHRPAASGDSGNGGITWYRFDLPREQVPLYREHLIKTWLDHMKHRVEDGGGDAAFEGGGGGPPFWDASEFDDGTRVRLLESNGDVAFQAAFSASRGRVYVRVNH